MALLSMASIPVESLASDDTWATARTPSVGTPASVLAFFEVLQQPSWYCTRRFYNLSESQCQGSTS